MHRAEEAEDYGEVRAHLIKAANALPPARKSDLRSIHIRVSLGQMLRQTKAPDAAEQLFAEVLGVDPRNRAALLGRIEAALAANREADALVHAKQALAIFPGDNQIACKFASVAIRLQHYEDAIRVLTPRAAAEKADAAILNHLGRAHQLMGGYEAAMKPLRRALDIEPHNSTARQNLIGVCLSSGDLTAALREIESGLEVFPQDAHLMERLVVTLKRLDRPMEAVQRVRSLVDPVRSPLNLCLALADAMRMVCLRQEAEEILKVLVERDPTHANAWTLRTQLALSTGDVDRAFEINQTALQSVPEDLAIQKLHGVVLLRSGQSDVAVDYLCECLERAPEDVGIRNEYANALLAAGAPEEADAIFAAVLDERPHNHPARMGRINAAEARGDLEAAMVLIESHNADASSDTPFQCDDPALLVRYAELAHSAADATRVTRALPILQHVVADLPDTQILRLIKTGKALGNDALFGDLVAETLQRDRIIEPLALTVLRLSYATTDQQQTEAVQDRLEKIVHPANRRTFIVEATRLRLGPEESYRVARRVLRRAERPDIAVHLAQAVKASGRAQLAARYLRRCARRWPMSKKIRLALVSAYTQCGEFRAAETFVERLETQHIISEPERTRLWLHVLLEVGDLHRASRLLDNTEIDYRHEIPAMKRLHVSVFQGDLEGARNVLQATQLDRQPDFHSSTHIGAVLNELALYRLASAPDAAVSPENAASYFHAAREVVASRTGRQPSQTMSGESPTRRVMQYWDEAEIPEAVSDIMASWREISGWHYECFDRRAAIRWLEENCGPDHVRAFCLSKQPAQEADFLRLCLLEVQGGLYVDCDDKCIGSPDRLLARTTGAVVFSEYSGAIANNVIYAPPRHPVMSIAVRLAHGSLLRRDNDSTWTKSGPGLLTRAVAKYTLEYGEQADRDLTILHQADMRKDVCPHLPLPHKATNRYWNASANRVPDAVRRALRCGT